MSNPQIDPNLAQYVFNQTGIPTAYTGQLQNLGFLGVPYGSVTAEFQAQQQFQRMLKSIMDRQMQSFHMNTADINALPYNMRSLMNAAAPAITDPLYGIEGAQGMLSNGYTYGDLPNNPTRAWDIWQSQQQNPYSPAATGYPNFAPPALSSFAAPGSFSLGGGGSSPQDYPNAASRNNPHNALVGHYTVPLAGGGSMTVNASSPEEAANNVRAQGGNPDTGGNITGQNPHAPGSQATQVG